jgi:hypothetical protein
MVDSSSLRLAVILGVRKSWYTIVVMFCPECRAEYRPGFTRCADCEVELVHEIRGHDNRVQKPTRDSKTTKFYAGFISLVWIPAGFLGLYCGEIATRGGNSRLMC